MKFEMTFFHCGEYLKETLATYIEEVISIVSAVEWVSNFQFSDKGKPYEHQAGYNRSFEVQFLDRNWELRPLLRKEPKLIGDFRKDLVFIEVQFGNSAALFRDYYKFQYGLSNGLLSLAVLIVPTKPKEFFPTRPHSVQNMADYDLVHTCFSILPINVPTLIIGLLPEN